jgi:hypothetical protein
MVKPRGVEARGEAAQGFDGGRATTMHVVDERKRPRCGESFDRGADRGAGDWFVERHIEPKMASAMSARDRGLEKIQGFLGLRGSLLATPRRGVGACGLKTAPIESPTKINSFLLFFLPFIPFFLAFSFFL